MKEQSTLARPYAKAAFDFALAHKTLKEWRQSLKDAAAIVSNKSFCLLIDNPNISREQLRELFFSILDKELDEYQENFIRLLIQNDRLVILPEIMKKFLSHCDKHEKRTDVSVTSAFELTDAQKKGLTGALEKRLKLNIKLNCEIDKTILGGAIIRAGDRVFNYSGRFILDKLASDLRGKH